MLTLYTVPESLYCAKLRILLRHKGLTWRELPPPGGYGSDEYKKTVPSGSLPAMIDGDLLLADSEAIAEYLNERYPEPPMLMGDAASRGLIRQLSRFHDTRLEPAVRLLFPQMRPEQRDPGMVDAAMASIRMRLTQLEPFLADTPCAATGQGLTLGDCGYPISFRWIERLSAELGSPIALPPAAAAYEIALKEHSSVSEELDAYRASIDAWVDRVTISHSTVRKN
ncbi:MAG: glutathione S-transferase family protein [Paracoccaceae bacterium]